MKKSLQILLLLLLFGYTGRSLAQPMLQVTVAYFTPDSTAFSTITNLTYIVQNVGGTAFSGEVSINIGTPLLGADSVDNFLISLSPGDTVSRTSGVLVTPSRFNVGDNTVIIWPTAKPTSGGSFEGIADTTTLHVFSGTRLDISGRGDLFSWEKTPDEGILLSVSKVVVRPEQIRLVDLSGRNIELVGCPGGYRTVAPVHGVALAEIRLSDGRIWRKKIFSE